MGSGGAGGTGLPGGFRRRCGDGAFLLLAGVCAATVFSTAIMQILVVLLLAAYVVCSIASWPPPWRRTAIDVPFAGFILARLLSVAFSTDPVRSLPALHIEFVFYSVFFVATQTFPSEVERRGRIVVNVLIMAAAVASLIGIAQVLFLGEPRAVSTTAGTYTLGGFLVCVLPLALLLPWQWMWVRGTARGVVVTLICLGIIFTFDRLHWAAMVLVVAAGGLFFRRRVLPVALFAAVLIVWLSPTVQVRLAQAIHPALYASGRDVLWKGARMLMGAHPLTGFGPRTFTEIFPLFDQLTVRGVGSWHNDYLQVYMESGLLGLLPLAWLVIAVYFQSVRWLRRRTAGSEQRQVVLALLGSVTVVFLIGGIIDTHVGIIFRVLLALLALHVSGERGTTNDGPAL